MSSNQYDLAIDEYSQAIQLGGSNEEVYYKRGVAYRKAGNLHSAEADFTSVIEIAPDKAQAYADRSLTRALLNKIDAAVEDMDKAIDLDEDMIRVVEDDMAEAYLKLGIAYRERTKVIHAQAFLGKVIHLTPEIPEVYIERAQVYNFVGWSDLAIKDLGKAITYDPDSITAYMLRCKTLMDTMQYEGALADAEKLVALDRKSSHAFYFRGLAYFLLGENEPSLSDMEEAIFLDNTNAAAYLIRGQVYMQKNMYTAANDDFSRVLILATDIDLIMKAEGFLAELENY